MQTVQRFHKLVDRRLAQFGIRRVRHLSVRHQFHVQRTLTRQRQLVFGGLAVNHEARADRLPVGHLRADRISFFAHQKQQPGENACPAQLLSCQNLRRNNPLCVARAAPVNAPFVFGRCDERRHRIHVRGENNLRTIISRPCSQHISARPLDRHLLSFEPASPQLVAKKISHRTFIRSDGFDIDQMASKRKQVHAGKE